jgi:type II secretory pathway component PulC
LIRPDSFRHPSHGTSSPAAHISSAPSLVPVIKEVRLQTRDILPSTTDLSPKTQEPPASAVQKSPTSVTDTKIPELHLKGISLGGTRSWAFVNDRMLKVGDTIEGAEVVDILKDRVKLKYAGVEFSLSY